MKKLEKCFKIVQEVIRKDCREEAKKILEISDEDIHNEIISYHKEKQFNIVCLVLDRAVDILVKNNKWKIIKDSCFKGMKASFDIEDDSVFYLGIDDNGDENIFTHQPTLMNSPSGKYWECHYKKAKEIALNKGTFKKLLKAKKGECYIINIELLSKP